MTTQHKLETIWLKIWHCKSKRTLQLLDLWLVVWKLFYLCLAFLCFNFYPTKVASCPTKPSEYLVLVKYLLFLQPAFALQNFAWHDGSPVGFQHVGLYQSVNRAKYFAEGNPVIKGIEVSGYNYKFLKDNYDRIQRSSMYSSYFHVNHNSTACVIMILMNLISPEWHFTACDTPKYDNIFCTIRNLSNLGDTSKRTSFNTSCTGNGFMLVGQKCITIMWKNASFLPGNFCQIKNLECSVFLHMNQVSFLTESVTISPLILLFKPKYTMVLQYDKTQDSYIQEGFGDQLHGYQLCEKPVSTITVKSNLYQCHNKVFSSVLLQFEKHSACQNTDEKEMQHLQNLKKVIHKSTLQKGVRCFLLPVDQLKNKCKEHYTQIPQTTQSEHVTDTRMFTFQRGSEADNSSVIPNSFETSQSEGKYSEVIVNCGTSDDKENAFFLSQLCTFTLTGRTEKVSCVNGRQLENCEQFECNMKFKCPGYYCIPWEYVCNNRWDCPQGTDESTECGNLVRCETMYKCQGASNICIHTGSTCDGQNNCPLGDDEILCELKDITCPTTCFCRLLVLVCQNSLLLQGRPYPHFVFILQETAVSRRQIVNFKRAILLEISSTALSDICFLELSSMLHTLHIPHNYIRVIKVLCFANDNHLTNINLNHNMITTIHCKGFFNLASLTMVNLSQNKIINLPHFAFFAVEKLSVISMRESGFYSFTVNSFQIMSLNVIEVTFYQLCCFIPNKTKCHSTNIKPWYESCGKILQTGGVSVSFIATMSFVVILNALHFVVLCTNGEISKPFGVISLSVFFCKLFWVVYQILIWAANVRFLEDIIYGKWKSQDACFIAADCSMIFFITDPLSSYILSLSRHMMAAHPLTSKFKEYPYCLKFVLQMYFYSFVLCSICVVALKMRLGTLPTNFCLPFLDPTGASMEIKVITILVASCQIFIGFGMTVSHLLIVFYVKDSANKTQQLHQHSKAIVTQLTFIFLSYIACWFTTSIVFSTLIGMDEYDTNLPMWVVICVVPFHSLTMPVILIVVALREKGKSKHKRKPDFAHVKQLSMNAPWCCQPLTKNTNVSSLFLQNLTSDLLIYPPSQGCCVYFSSPAFNFISHFELLVLFWVPILGVLSGGLHQEAALGIVALVVMCPDHWVFHTWFYAQHWFFLQGGKFHIGFRHNKHTFPFLNAGLRFHCCVLQVNEVRFCWWRWCVSYLKLEHECWTIKSQKQTSPSSDVSPSSFVWSNSSWTCWKQVSCAMCQISNYQWCKLKFEVISTQGIKYGVWGSCQFIFNC